MNHIFFLYGIAMTTFAFSSIFFLKFWNASRDSFFLYFCIACALLAFERVVILLGTYQHVGPHQAEVSIWVYMIRLLAFSVILTAVVTKNRSSNRS
ncbi:MAG: DUF5985 family protein [Bdellovibrionota bacterium]